MLIAPGVFDVRCDVAQQLAWFVRYTFKSQCSREQIAVVPSGPNQTRIFVCLNQATGHCQSSYQAGGAYFDNLPTLTLSQETGGCLPNCCQPGQPNPWYRGIWRSIDFPRLRFLEANQPDPTHVLARRFASTDGEEIGDSISKFLEAGWLARGCAFNLD